MCCTRIDHVRLCLHTFHLFYFCSFYFEFDQTKWENPVKNMAVLKIREDFAFCFKFEIKELIITAERCAAREKALHKSWLINFLTDINRLKLLRFYGYEPIWISNAFNHILAERVQFCYIMCSRHGAIAWYVLKMKSLTSILHNRFISQSLE